MAVRGLRTTLVAVLATCFFAATPLAAQAGPGGLDGSFGSGGTVMTQVTPNSDLADGGVAVQSDGKIVAAGRCSVSPNFVFCLARYNTDGSLDTSFDADGKVLTSMGTGEVAAHALAIQSDQKVVVAGTCRNPASGDVCLARYDTDGSLDASFDSDGRLTTAIGSGFDVAHAVAIQSDQKIVAAGTCLVGSASDFCLARYNTDGSLDTSFDTDGKLTTAIGTTVDSAQAVALQSDGKIIAAGFCQSGAPEDFCLARYNTDGSLDTSFDTDGLVVTQIGTGLDSAYAVAIRSDGKIIAAGNCRVGSANGFCVARYNTDGSLDTSFDTDGKVITPIGFNAAARAVVVRSDGRTTVVGHCGAGLPSDEFCIARYTADGSLDSSFGTGGKVITAVSTGNDRADSAAVQSDGRIVVAGPCGSASNLAFCLARYDEVLPGSFGLTAAKGGTGFGRVTGTGINCGADCFEPYASGTEVTLTAAAGHGSFFAGWSGCDSATAASCTVTLSSNRTVTASFTATPTFVDVPPSNPFYEYIEHLFDLGITTGCNPPTNDMFCPADFVPRQQMAAFLIRAKGLTQLFPATPSFVDVPTSNPFFGYIERLKEQAITTGCNPPTNDMFCPADFVPRQQMAAFLVRAKGLTQLFPATPSFTDVPASNPFFGYIERLREQGITTGCNPPANDRYCPDENVPRQQMAAFLIRAFASS